MLYNNATDLAANFRAFLKDAGIKARCRKVPALMGAIQVYPISHEALFDTDTQLRIRAHAIGLGLTLVRGLPIDVDRMTDPKGMEFYLPRLPSKIPPKVVPAPHDLLDPVAKAIHDGLGGDGWAYSNYTMNEMNTHHHKLHSAAKMAIVTYLKLTGRDVEASKMEEIVIRG